LIIIDERLMKKTNLKIILDRFPDEFLKLKKPLKTSSQLIFEN